MSKNTPEPWAQLNYCVYGQSQKGNVFDLQIAECSFEDNDLSHEECEANARLIAAAPDLLEALKDLVDQYGPVESNVWRRARAAINKAEGEL